MIWPYKMDDNFSLIEGLDKHNCQQIHIYTNTFSIHQDKMFC